MIPKAQRYLVSPLLFEFFIKPELGIRRRSTNGAKVQVVAVSILIQPRLESKEAWFAFCCAWHPDFIPPNMTQVPYRRFRLTLIHCHIPINSQQFSVRQTWLLRFANFRIFIDHIVF